MMDMHTISVSWIEERFCIDIKKILASSDIRIRMMPYYPGYKAMALCPVHGHPWPYNEYKVMAL